jgi:hypothetical protein
MSEQPLPNVASVIELPEAAKDQRFRIRITKMGFVRADQIVLNPDNFREHPQTQRTALRAALEEIGIINVVILQDGTDLLIDGHERMWQADDADAYMPAIWVDLDDEETRKALLTLDPIASLAVTNREKLAEVSAQVRWQNDSLASLVESMSSRPIPFAGGGLRPNGAGPGNGPGQGSELDYGDIPVSAIRMFQLFLTVRTHETFVQRLAALEKEWELNNATDAAYKAVEWACAELGIEVGVDGDRRDD